MTDAANETIRVLQAPARAGARCQCGERIAVGRACVEIRAPADPIGYLLEGQSFCGLPCARVYLLEMSETLDAGAASRALADYDSVYAAMRAILAVVERERLLQRIN